MKKNKIVICVLFLALVLCGCQQETTKQRLEINNQVKKQKDQNLEQLAVSGKDYVLIYYPNQNKTNLLTKKIQLKDVDGDKICKELIRAGVFSSTVQIQTCAPMKEDDKVCLNLDFNEEFQKQLYQCENSEEKLLIGAVVNSYLSSFSYSAVRLTVNGKLIQSRYTEVDGFWKKYSETQEDMITEQITYDGNNYMVKGRKFVSEMGFSTIYNTDLFEYNFDAEANVATFSLKGNIFSDKAYLAISVCDYPLRQTVEGLQLQSSIPLSLTGGTFGLDKLTGFQLHGQQGMQYLYDFCLEMKGKVYLLEIKYEGGNPEKYIPQLMACVRQFSLLQ